jgi:hypothetical protein
MATATTTTETKRTSSTSSSVTTEAGAMAKAKAGAAKLYKCELWFEDAEDHYESWHFISFAHTQSKERAYQMFSNALHLKTTSEKMQLWSSYGNGLLSSSSVDPYPSHMRQYWNDEMISAKQLKELDSKIFDSIKDCGTGEQGPIVVPVHLQNYFICRLQECPVFKSASKQRADNFFGEKGEEEVARVPSSSSSEDYLFVCPTHNIERKDGVPQVIAVLAKDIVDAAKKIIDAHKRLGVAMDDKTKKMLAANIYRPEGEVVSVVFQDGSYGV